MPQPVISATGLFTPDETITNDELVSAFNAYVDLENARNSDKIKIGEVDPLVYSDADFIFKASGIKQRFVLDKTGVLDPTIMRPVLPERHDNEPSIMAEIALSAAKEALEKAGKTAAEIDTVICAASNHERAYPAIAVEVQSLLGAQGFAFDMNVACSSATFAIQNAADMIRSGNSKCVLIVNPEICSAHLEWRDRDCHFIFGDVCTAIIVEDKSTASKEHFEIVSTKCATKFSNNIRNNLGFLRRTREGHNPTDRRDMQFRQEGRRVFKEVVPMVSGHMLDHLKAQDFKSDSIKRMWLHQANKSMNDFIGKSVLGRTPSEQEQPNILEDYANTSSAGSIIAFHKYSDDLASGEIGIICSFGAGYSVGSVLLKRA